MNIESRLLFEMNTICVGETQIWKQQTPADSPFLAVTQGEAQSCGKSSPRLSSSWLWRWASLQIPSSSWPTKVICVHCAALLLPVSSV